MPTNFLEAAGTSGFITTVLNLQTTELNALAAAHTAVSTVGGTSGVFSQTNIGSGIFGDIWLKFGGTFTPAPGDSLFGYFLRSPDGGSTFEKTVSNVQPPRPPDFIIPLYNSAYASGDLAFASGLVKLPYTSFKVLTFPNIGATTFPATGNVLTVGPEANQY